MCKLGFVTEAKKTAAPVSEAGYVASGTLVDGWTIWDPFEKTPELQWPQAISIYARMGTEDSRVTSLLEAITLPILSTAWRLKQENASDEVLEFVSRNLDVPIETQDEVVNPGRTRDRFSWHEHLEDCAGPTLQYGHSFFEQVYRPRQMDPDGKGRFWIRKVAPRPQWTILRINVALDGGLVSIEQIAPPQALYSGAPLSPVYPAQIPVNRLVAYTRNQRPGMWTGTSILRSAYKHWLLKDKLLRIEAATAERNGMGIPVGTASRPDDPDETRAMARLAQGLRGGLNAGVGLSSGQILELLGVSGNLPDIRRAIEGHDKAIALSGLAHFLNLDGKGGSYALASVLEDPFVQAVQGYATKICRIANGHIVEDLVDINFGIDEGAPRLVFDPIGSRQDLTAAAIKLLFDAGIFDDDPGVARAIRQRFGLPSKDESQGPETGEQSGGGQQGVTNQPARTRSSGGGGTAARSRRAQGVLF